MEDDENNTPPDRPESLLPYDAWTEEALRHVVIRALAHAGAHGLPGDHHFYVSFRTDRAGVVIPQRLTAQYPHEMTIVLQHQFWDLQVDEPGGWFSIGLSFGGIPTTLRVPFDAITAFADPHVQFGLRFRPQGEDAANDAAEQRPENMDERPQVESPWAGKTQPERTEPDRPAPDGSEPPADAPQVVSLDAFRKRPPTKE